MGYAYVVTSRNVCEGSRRWEQKEFTWDEITRFYLLPYEANILFFSKGKIRRAASHSQDGTGRSECFVL